MRSLVIQSVYEGYTPARRLSITNTMGASLKWGNPGAYAVPLLGGSVG